jgi:hypothetical protein
VLSHIDLAGRLDQVILVERVLDVAEQFGALAREVEPAPQQVTRSSHAGWIDVSYGDRTAA